MKSVIPILVENINDYKAFTVYPNDLVEFCNNNKIKLPIIDSKRGQALALLAQPEIRNEKYISRNEAELFFKNIGRKPGDAIQAFNKDFSLVRHKLRGFYCLKFPFECDLTDYSKRNNCQLSEENKNATISSIKNWYLENIINVPDSKWQIGHLDPTIPDASESNLAWQPPIQSKWRDRFKFSADFKKMWPTAAELVSKFNEYYTHAEQIMILNYLFQKRELAYKEDNQNKNAEIN